MCRRSAVRALFCAVLGTAAACDGTAPVPQAGGPPVSSPADAGGSSDAPATPPRRDTGPALPEQPAPGWACALQIRDVALYQSVKRPLAELPAGSRAVDVVAGRAALVRVFVDAPVAGAPGDNAVMRLSLQQGDGSAIAYDAAAALSGSSADGELNSTFNFSVAAGDIGTDTSLTVQLVGASACPAGGTGVLRFPSSGAPLPLKARRVGRVQVRLVPVRYDTDGSGRLPDTSEAQLARYRGLLEAMYPIEGVDLQVREPVATSVMITANGGWTELLDSLRALRAQDGVAPELYDFALVTPRASLSAYCRSGCTAGLAYRVDSASPNLRVGVGLGFSGDSAASTLAHELGHEHGLGHSPCSVTEGLDEAYPYPKGVTGTWGFDPRGPMLLGPTTYTDIMGYCRPQWISDYSFQLLLERSTRVNPGAERTTLASRTGPAATAIGASAPRRWRVLIEEADGRRHWGAPVRVPTAIGGIAEMASVTDHTGGVVPVEVRRVEIADVGASTVFVPEPLPTWKSLTLRGAAAVELTAP